MISEMSTSKRVLAESVFDIFFVELMRYMRQDKATALDRMDNLAYFVGMRLIER